MTTYYADYVNGNDANNGLGPDASHASNKPWKTLAKVLGASGIASGDTVYLSPAGPFRERTTVAMTSPTGETLVIGDPTNSRGFKTSGGVLVAPADAVVLTAYETSDVASPSASAAVVDLAGRDYLTFRNLLFVAGGNATSGTCIKSTTNTSTNIVFDACGFFNTTNASFSTTSALVNITSAKNVALAWRFNRCFFFQGHAGVGIHFAPLTPDTADFDLDVILTNCRFFGTGSRAVRFVPGASGAFDVGGVICNHCWLCYGTTAAFETATRTSTTYPCQVNNSLVIAAIGLVANTSGQLTNTYTRIAATTPRTNVTLGTGSAEGDALAMAFAAGLHYEWNTVARPFGTPLLSGMGSGLTGFGSASPASTDALNRPRPSGGLSTSCTVGPFERHDGAVQETSVVDAGSNAISLTGPHDCEFSVPVDASSTTFSIRVRYDTNHGTGSKPQAILLANDKIGVATETKTAAAGIDTWETLTFSAFTPSAKGMVTIRLVSRSAAGNGIAYFDTFSVA